MKIFVYLPWFWFCHWNLYIFFLLIQILGQFLVLFHVRVFHSNNLLFVFLLLSTFFWKNPWLGSIFTLDYFQLQKRIFHWSIFKLFYNIFYTKNYWTDTQYRIRIQTYHPPSMYDFATNKTIWIKSSVFWCVPAPSSGLKRNLYEACSMQMNDSSL